MRRGLLAIAVAGYAGCASGVCTECPTAALTANGDTELTAHVGDMIGYAWASTNADSASSTVDMAPSADACGNHDGPWVVTTVSGSVAPSPILACQVGTTYTLAFVAAQSDTGDAATATVTITVAP